MTKQRPPQLARVVQGLLGELVVINVTFLFLVRTGGPLIGLTFYLALLVVVWHGRRKDYRPVVVGGPVGLAVHIGEVILVGWSNYPLLTALNIIFPAVLVPAAWLAGREV